MANKNVIGVTSCPHCGSLQELRVNSGQYIYVKCHGQVENIACGFQAIWPRLESVKAKADAAARQWLGPIPYGYFPPTKEQGNAYGHNFETLDYETRRDTEPYIVKLIERGKRPTVSPTPTPEPAPRAEPEPAPKPEPGTKPRRFRFGGGG